jgi:hypothetical protein
MALDIAREGSGGPAIIIFLLFFVYDNIFLRPFSPTAAAPSS